jgi:hypothetical protein
MEAGGPGLNLPAMGSLHIRFTFIANAVAVCGIFVTDREVAMPSP